METSGLGIGAGIGGPAANMLSYWDPPAIGGPARTNMFRLVLGAVLVLGNSGSSGSVVRRVAIEGEGEWGRRSGTPEGRTTLRTKDPPFPVSLPPDLPNIPN